MDISNSLILLQRDPELMAWRERGIAVAVTPTGTILRVLVAHPYPWRPRLQDLVAVDWQTGTQEQFYRKYRPAELGQSA